MYNKRPENARRDFTPRFEFRDYEEEFWGECVIMFASRRTVDMLSSAGRVLEYYNSRWTIDGEYDISPDDRETISQWVNQAFLELNMTCDISDLILVLTRIADALDGGSPNRYDIDDVVTALGEIETGLGVEDFVDMLSFWKVLISKLPNLSFNLAPRDLIEMALSMRFNASKLNYLEDIALSQRGILISEGGTPIQGIYENLGDTFNTAAAGITGGNSAGIQWLWQVVKGKDIQIGQDLFDFLNGLLFGSIRGATYDVEDAINDLNIPDLQVLIDSIDAVTAALDNSAYQGQHIAALQDIGDTLNTRLEELTQATVDLCSCPQVGGVCSCGAGGGGSVIEAPPIVLNGDCYPQQFSTEVEYLDYKEKAVWFVLDKLFEVPARLCSLHDNFSSDWRGSSQERWGISFVYSQVGALLPTVADQLLLYNMPEVSRSQVITAYTDRYYKFATQVFQEVPEVSTYDDVINPWFSIFCELANWYEDEATTLAQSLINAAHNIAAITGIIETAIGDAVTYGIAQVASPNEVQTISDIMGYMYPVGFLNNILFLNPRINNYPVITELTKTEQCDYSYSSSCYQGVGPTIIEIDDYLELQSGDVGGGAYQRCTGSMVTTATVGVFEQGPSDDPAVGFRYTFKLSGGTVYESNTPPSGEYLIDEFDIRGDSPFNFIIRQTEC